MLLNSNDLKDLVRSSLNSPRFFFDLMRVVVNKNLHPERASSQLIRIALVSDATVSTSEEQLNLFSSYRSELRDHLSVVALHLPLKVVLSAPKVMLSTFDIVILKMSFRTNAPEAVRIAQKLRHAIDQKRMIYFDGDDDLCIQWPAILPYVDLYVKKHLFLDRSQYLTRFIGKSNLTDFVHRRFGCSFSEDLVAAVSGQVPADQLAKLQVGFNLALDRKIIELYKRCDQRISHDGREIDVTFRGSVPKDWIYYLRKDIEPNLRRLKGSHRVASTDKRVSAEEYYQEMLKSKICISPFGYGEICWRDFEAILCGALLVKPDMSYVETYPDIFEPYQTYVPVQWDFSDLEDKCEYYLTREDDRRRIVSNAFNVLDKFYRCYGFMKPLASILLARPS